MQRISYDRHRFPPEVIRHSVWLYLRFTLSYRDFEELLAERGLEVSYETVRRWVLGLDLGFARNLRRLRPRPSDLGCTNMLAQFSAPLTPENVVPADRTPGNGSMLMVFKLPKSE